MSDAPAAQPTDADRLTPHANLRTVEAVVNAASGSVGPGAADRLSATLDRFGLQARVVAPSPSDIASAVAEARARNPDLLITLAGDGTAGLAAQTCGADGPLLITLPGGTMNMLPFALYGRVSWEAALQAALTDGRPHPVSGGEVGGRAFYVAAILGEPTLWAKAREAMRAGRVKRALRRSSYALSRAFVGRLRFSLEGGEEQKARALTLMCPLVSRALDDETRALEAAALNVHGAGEAFRLGFNMMMGDWRRDPSVAIQLVRSGRAWAQGRIPAVIDGEPTRFHKTVDIRFVRVAFNALVPPSPESPAA